MRKTKKKQNLPKLFNVGHPKIVFLVRYVNGKIARIGSAIPLRIPLENGKGFRYFLITAHHVVDPRDKLSVTTSSVKGGRLHICFPKVAKGIFKIDFVRENYVDIKLFSHEGMQNDLDVAIVPIRRIDEFERRFVDVSEISLKERYGRYFVAGTPYEGVSNQGKDKEIFSISCCFTRWLPKGKKPKDIPLEEGVFYLRHDPKSNMPKMGGFSGGGVWKYNRRKLNPKLVGVQVAAMHGHYIKCSKIRNALQLVYGGNIDGLSDPLGLYKKTDGGILVIDQPFELPRNN